MERQKKIRRMVALLTDHFLNQHLLMIAIGKDLTCRAYCENETDSRHVLGMCLALRSMRLRYFRDQLL